MSILEISGPANVGAAEPEVARHVMPLVKWSGKDGESFDDQKKSCDAHGDEIQRLWVGAKSQSGRAEAINHATQRTENVAQEHDSGFVGSQRTAQHPATNPDQNHLQPEHARETIEVEGSS